MKQKLLAFSVLLVGISFLSVEKASAARVSFTANDNKEGVPIGVDVVATDIGGGIKFDLKVNYSTFATTGDFFTAYVNFSQLYDLSNITSVQGAYNGVWGLDQRNIFVSQDISQKFDLVVLLNQINPSQNLLMETSFSVFGQNLSVSELLSQEFAAGLRSVGSDPLYGGYSTAIQFGLIPESSDSGYYPVATPEPLTILGTGTALGFGVLFKNRLNSLVRK